MKRPYIYIIGVGLLLSLAGCSDDEVSVNDDGQAIRFECHAPWFATRSVVNSISDLQGGSFGVFAYYTGSSDYASPAKPDFMYNQEVKYGSGSWTYTPLKYWPNGEGVASDDTGQGATQHKVSFFAYYPYSEALDAELSSPYQPTISYTWAAANDLLYDNTQKNLTKQAVNGKVSFNFRHAVALVEFKVRRKEATGSAITLKSLTINSNANTSGAFNLVTKTWASTSGDNAQPLNHTTPDIDVTASEDASAQTVGTSVMIPGTVTFSYTIKYTVGDNNYTRSADMTSKELEKNTKYTVVFVIDGDAVDSYVLREREAEQW